MCVYIVRVNESVRVSVGVYVGGCTCEEGRSRGDELHK